MHGRVLRQVGVIHVSSGVDLSALFGDTGASEPGLRNRHGPQVRPKHMPPAHRLAAVRRRAIMLQIARTKNAPIIEARKPAPSGRPYQPTS